MCDNPYCSALKNAHPFYLQTSIGNVHFLLFKLHFTWLVGPFSQLLLLKKKAPISARTLKTQPWPSLEPRQPTAINTFPPCCWSWGDVSGPVHLTADAWNPAMDLGAFASKPVLIRPAHKYKLLNSFLGWQCVVAFIKWWCCRVLVGAVAKMIKKCLFGAVQAVLPKEISLG